MKNYIDRHRDAYGVEPICGVLQMAPSCYWRHAARQRNPQLRSQRAHRDEGLKADIQRVWHANWQVYGADKVWLQMNREGIRVARCTVERLMRTMGLQGARRGKTVRTTTADTSAPCPLDHVNRQFKASRPNELWVSDFTYVSTWQGWLYVAFVMDVYARRIVGWRVSRSMQTDFVLDALEQALYDRQPAAHALTHHSDRGSQYVSIRYTERLDQAGIRPSVGSRGDSYDNALAETINGLYKAEMIHRRGPWKTRESVELATLQWVHWFNHTRLLTPIGGIPRQRLRQTTGGNSPSPTPRQRCQLKPTGLLESRGGSLSRCVRVLLLHVHELPALIRDWVAMMGRSLVRHLPGGSQPRQNTRHKPHPSQAYKRAA
ncbi:IS3 family transposase [Hydrogenophaga soli]